MRLAYVTNNASRTPAAIAAQLAGFGVQAAAADIVTSAQAAATLLASRLAPGAAVLVIGSTALRIAVRERGLRPVSTALDRPAAVLQGYAPGVGYSQFLEGGLAVRAGAWFVASNADATLPTPRGIQPGNGSLCQVIAHATGQQPAVAGKPEPPLHAEAVARTGARHPLVVGDRLDTDIEGAVRVGAASLLVLTGSQPPGRRRAGRTQPAAQLPRGRPGRAARAAASGDQPGTGVLLRRMARATAVTMARSSASTARGIRWTGCARCAPRPGRWTRSAWR